MRILPLNALPPPANLEDFSLPFVLGGRHMGFLHVTACPDAIRSIAFHENALKTQASRYHPALEAILCAYLAGEQIAHWPTAVALPAQPFLLACWRALAQVPYGETLSYSELARRAGNPKAIRAAASACARNPVPLLIPCHRVLAKNGGLGGFGWGIEMKRELLTLESKQRAYSHYQKAC